MPRVIFLLVLLFTAAGFLGATEVAAVKVELEQLNASENYRFRATVEAESGEVLASPRVTFPRGELVKTSTLLPSGVEVVLEVRVEPEGEAAEYSVRLVSEEKSRVVQKASIRL